MQRPPRTAAVPAANRDDKDGLGLRTRPWLLALRYRPMVTATRGRGCGLDLRPVTDMASALSPPDPRP